jgi:hypothetical protein
VHRRTVSALTALAVAASLGATVLRSGGYRIVLGAISVPPPYLEQVVESPW